MKLIFNGKALGAFLLSGGLILAATPVLTETIWGKELSLSRKDLWRVVHRVCIPASEIGLPFPCAKVVLSEGRGYAILPVGAGHILTVPTQPITGIESREILAHDQPNYWQAAWEARSDLENGLSRKLDRGDVALALNSAYARSQDQLHIHTACVKSEVKAALAADRAAIGPRWSRMKAAFDWRRYWVRWAPGADLSTINVFDLLPPETRKSHLAMARQTLIVVGGWDRSHAPGFFILNDQSSENGAAHGESLLDFNCQN